MVGHLVPGDTVHGFLAEHTVRLFPDEIFADRVCSQLLDNWDLETLTDHLCERLQKTNYEVVSSRRAGEKSQIVCIRHTGGLTSMDLYSHLKKRNIITAPRGDRLRISPHFYNTLEEIEELVKALP